MGKGANVYEIISEKIIDMLDKDIVPWRMPWKHTTDMPKNIKGRKYSGINVWLLAFSGYPSNYWLTYKQAQALGSQVRKGEKSSMVVFWKQLEVEDTDNLTGEKTKKRIPLLRYCRVFNVAQCDGIDDPAGLDVTNLPEFDSIEACENIVRDMPLKPEIAIGARACYYPSLDKVEVPDRRLFDSPERYYGTLFHELGHSTMHETRLNRKSKMKMAAFGSETYSKEELVAEFCSSFLCGIAEIENKTLDNNAAYIKHWKEAIKADAKLVVFAASQGEKAAKYIIGGE